MFGGSWASPRLLWLSHSEHSPGSAHVSPFPVLQAGKLLGLPRGRLGLTGLGSYLSGEGKSGLAARNDFTPKPRDAQPGPAGTWKYLEVVLTVLASGGHSGLGHS